MYRSTVHVSSCRAVESSFQIAAVLARFSLLCSLGARTMASKSAGGSGSEASALKHLTADELEFLAEDELVEIVPSESHKTLHLRGTYGPFIAGTVTVVPLWLAVMLKRRNNKSVAASYASGVHHCYCKYRASIACPDWMKVENLESIWRQEKRDEEFASLPFHYLEISSLLLSVAPDDMGPDCDRMRTLLEDIEN
eukprot:19873-Heterococcus_DN1.PRE.1